VIDSTGAWVLNKKGVYRGDFAHHREVIVKAFSCLIALAFALVIAAPAQAAVLDFQAVLNGNNQVPANASTATGTADVMLNDVTDMLTVNVAFTDLVGGPATAAHIHCCGAPGTNAAVQLPFTGFPAATSGTFSQSYDLATALLLNGGVSEADFIAGLETGLAYVNIHDATFPGGEIRGQLILTAIPESSTWAMLLIGFAGIGFAAYRKSKGPVVLIG
jgi:hypothetical protein